MSNESSKLQITGIGMSIEVDHRDLAHAAMRCDPSNVSRGDGVIAAKNYRDRTGSRDPLSCLLQDLESSNKVARGHQEVAGIEHLKFFEPIDTKR